MPTDQVGHLRGLFWTLRRHLDVLRDYQFTLARRTHRRYGDFLIRARGPVLHRLFFRHLTRSQRAEELVSRQIAEVSRTLEALQEQLAVHRLLRSCDVLLA